MFNLIRNVVVVLAILVSQSYANVIHKILISGNHRVENSTIEYYMPLKKGNNFDSVKQDQTLKALYATDLFKSVQLDFGSDTLYVKVEELPIISKIEFKGNSKVKSATLSKDLNSNVGETIDQAKIQSDVEQIKELYKKLGRFSTQVKAIIETKENTRNKVIFDIIEGPKTSIRNIYFVGNENYRGGELKSVIQTKESSWLSFLDSNDTYNPDRIEYDKELLKQFYQGLGYADFQVISSNVNLSKTKEYFTLTFSLDEGDVYHINQVKSENKISAIDNADIQKYITIKSGALYNNKNLEDVAEKIAEYLGSKGYPQISVQPRLDKNYNDHTVDVTFVVEPAEKVFINQIDIEGNTKTEDKVIRRELKIEEGDVFDRAQIVRSQHNIRNLDYFEKLNLNLIPTSKKDRYNVKIEVEEKSTSSFNIDFGYNSAGGLFGQVGFNDRNVFGSGKYFNVGVTASKRNTNYSMSLTEPYFMDRDLALTGTVFKSHNNYGKRYLSSITSGGNEPDYKQDAIGFRIGLGYDISEDLRHNIDYTIKHDKLTANENESKFLNEQIGKYLTSAIGHTLTYDQLDSRVVPKNGYSISGSQEFAGVGGNVSYLQHDLEGQYYKSFLNNNLTLKLSASVGNITGLRNQGVRIPDRFYLGDYSFRGFQSAGLGPRDKGLEQAIGGQNKYVLTTELYFPLGLPKEYNVTGLVFCDVGDLWGVQLNKKKKLRDESLRYTKDDFYNEKFTRASVGVGFIWVTRFAPIRIDLAKPIRKKSYDEKQIFHIKFTTHL